MITAILGEIIKDILFRLSPARAITIDNGIKMWINPKDKSWSMRTTFRAYLNWRGIKSEQSTIELFKKTVKEGDLVLDLGANIGYFSLLAAKLGATVYSFEPESKNFYYLKENIFFNGFFDRIFPTQIAISNKKGETKLYLCPYDTGHHTINQYEGIRDYRQTSLWRKCWDLLTWNSGEKYTTIKTDTLDNLIGRKVDVIKMDVEGAEALALEGMDRILTENKNIKLFVEFFPIMIEKMGSSPEAFINKLLSYGFEINVIPGDHDAEGLEIVVVGGLGTTTSTIETTPIPTKVDNYSDLMRHCKLKDDHVNLFLQRHVAIQ